MDALRRLTLPPLRRFAVKHGYDLIDGLPSVDRPPAWGKVPLLSRLVRAYDLVIWVDADVLVVDDTTDVPDLPEHAFQALAEHRTEQGESLNTGVWVLRGADSDGRSASFLDAVWRNVRWVDHPWWEQAAVLDLLGYEVASHPAAAHRPPAGTSWSDGTSYLPAAWNRLDTSPDPAPHPYFVHYAGLPMATRLFRARLRLADQKPLSRLRRRLVIEREAVRRAYAAGGSPRVARMLTGRFARHVPDPLRHAVVDPVTAAIADRVVPERRQLVARQKVLAGLGDVVRSGPFADMILTRETSWSLHDAPYLLGSYEEELHPAVEALIGERPDVIVNIGAAEGYYAIGLARRLPAAEVHASDTDPRAREVCRANARLNGVQGRVRIHSVLSHFQLESLLHCRRSALICDCEGCEATLLDPEAVPSLRSASMIIELHDFIDQRITETLCSRFRESHTIEVVDVKPRRPTDYPALSEQVFQWATDEHRPVEPHPMQWAVCWPRT